MPQLVEILLVDDSVTDAELIMSSLQERLRVRNLLWLPTGEAALDFLRRKGEYANRGRLQPRLVILDKNLPGLNGLDVLQQMKADPALKLIPVVMLTGSSTDAEKKESYHLGVNSFILKPAESTLFATEIDRLGAYWMQVNQTL
ncbi:MAG: response regulator [Burkholderiales bacterium]|nr:response regulator [Burkholderiales bacterium]